jgi:hypothetical protein
MAEEMNNQPHALDHNDFEREDLSPGGVFYFMAGLAIVGIVIYFIVVGMYRFLDRYEREHQAVVSPLVTSPPYTRVVGPQSTEAFPQPRLEVNERTQLRDIIQKQDETLATYGWVDKEKGTVRIPIDRAIDLIAERGLPVRQENPTSAGEAAKANNASPASTPSTGVPQ